MYLNFCKKIPITLVAIVLPFVINAQTQRIDSLKKQITGITGIIDAQINKVEDKPKSRELYLRLVLTKAIVAVLDLQS